MGKVHLQSVGNVPGTPAENIKVGDILTWNFGYKATVTEVVKRTAKSVVIRKRYDYNGKEYERRLMFGRLVAANIPD